MQESLEHIQDHERAAALIVKYLHDDISPKEKNELESWVNAAEWHKTYFESCTSTEYLNLLMTDYHKAAELKDDLMAAIKIKMENRDGYGPHASSAIHRVYFFASSWFRYAVAIVVCLGIGAYFWTKKSSVNNNVASAVSNKKSVDDIKPGGQKALLTLADGSTIILDSAANGNLAQQGNTQVIKLASGEITYKAKGGAAEVFWNTMSTPVGGQYQVTLPDGTKVWLNAASSIQFPAIFGNEERNVKITGEAYFEVAKDKSKPFIISTPDDSITVLGTSFNVNSYNDEPASRTTLIAGSVKINDKIIKPGEAYSNGNIYLANIQQDIAWKNGVFSFNDADIPSVMRQLVRWYDLEVRYEKGIPQRKFRGKLPRDLQLSQVLKILNRTGGVDLKFQLNGKVLTISS